MRENGDSPSSENEGSAAIPEKDSPTNPVPPAGDNDEDKMHEMTASYSEISYDSQQSPLETTKSKLPDRPDHLELQPNDQYVEDLDGTITRDGDMVNFVAEDLEIKIKLASPVAKPVDGPYSQGSQSSCLYRQALTPQLPPIDPNVLNDLESEARRVASSVDTLTESLAGILHSVSALTVECLEIYRDAVCKTCDAVDSNIKAMYQLMAKCEELSKTMKPLYNLSSQMYPFNKLRRLTKYMNPPHLALINKISSQWLNLGKEMKRLLDLFENAVNS